MNHVNLQALKAQKTFSRKHPIQSLRKYLNLPKHDEPLFKRSRGSHVLFSGTAATMVVLATLMLFKTETAHAQKPIAIHDGTAIVKYDMFMPLKDVYKNEQMFHVTDWAGIASTPPIRFGPRDTTITQKTDTTITATQDTILTTRPDTTISPRPIEIYMTGVGVVGEVGAKNVPGNNTFNKVGLTGHIKLWGRFSFAYGHKWITAAIEAFDIQAGPRKIRIVDEQTLRDQDFSGQFQFEQPRGSPHVLGFLRKIRLDGTRFRNRNEIGDAYNVWRAQFGLLEGFGANFKYDTRPPQEDAPKGTFSFGASKEWGWKRGEYALELGGGYQLGAHAAFAELAAKIGPLILVAAHEREPGEKEALNSTHLIGIVDLADAYNRVFGSGDAPHGGHK